MGQTPEKWPKTASGLPSTAGTTASIAFIRRGKIYVGHVGDSAIVLGLQDPHDPQNWLSHPLTRDHKPESDEETRRIVRCGGKVIAKSGVPRVVWNRPRTGHKGPVRRSTHIDEIPFLAVARSLGDLWSYNSEEDVFVVSPEPDTFVYPIDIDRHRCLILGTDGAWNMLSPAQAVRIVCEAEKSNEQHMLNPNPNRQWINPSKKLVDKAIERWNGNNLRADNTSVVTVMLDPPGPPRAQVLKRQRELAQQLSAAGQPLLGDPAVVGLTNHPLDADRGSVALVTNTTPEEAPEPMSVDPCPMAGAPSGVPNPGNGFFDPSTSTKIISRCPNSKNRAEAQGHNLAALAQQQPLQPVAAQPAINPTAPTDAAAANSRILHDFVPARKPLNQRSSSQLNRLSDSLVDSTTKPSRNHDARGSRFASTASLADISESDAIQCNEISSSDDDSPADHGKRSASRLAGKCGKKSPTGAAKEAKLTRELNALQLDSPLFKNADLSRGRSNRRRTRSEDNHSDAENLDKQQPRTRKLRSARESVVDVEARCNQLKARIKSIERKVSKKTDQLNHEMRLLQSDLASSWEVTSSPTKGQPSQAHFLRSQHQGSPPKVQASHKSSARALRPRTPTSAKPSKFLSTPSLSLRKRRRLDDNGDSPVTKSPRTPSGTGRVKGSKPVITRSKTARVLTLKK
eukprot:maker-scaffold595_size129005-snap-gene-0.22 protein:Tk09123 transcript:maker-scaffold595_size129005-snap-gene-0.22-mRNA-1 annotation:"protein phosphatase 1d"